MKKAKRILSLITSLCMTSACFMSANASVSNESAVVSETTVPVTSEVQSKEDLEICIVVSVGEDEVLLNNDMAIYQKTFQEYSGESFNLKYGDVIGLANIHYLETAPMQPGLTENSYIKYFGSAEDYYAESMKNLTVTEISDDFEEITLIDLDGQSYTWYTRIELMDLYGRQYDIDPRSVNIGDVLNCITEPMENLFGEGGVFPVSTVTEPAETTAETTTSVSTATSISVVQTECGDNTSVVTSEYLPLVTSVVETTVPETFEVQSKEDLEICMVVSVGEDEVLLNNDMAIYQKTFQEYSGESFNLKYGDVIGLANIHYLETAPMQPGLTENSYIKYLGSAEEYYADSMKNLTVTEISDDFEEITLIDLDGQSYTWYTRIELMDLYGRQYDIDPRSVNIGDVLNCITEPMENLFGEGGVFPVSTVTEPVVTTTEKTANSSAVTLVSYIGAGDADTSIICVLTTTTQTTVSPVVSSTNDILCGDGEGIVTSQYLPLATSIIDTDEITIVTSEYLPLATSIMETDAPETTTVTSISSVTSAVQTECSFGTGVVPNEMITDLDVIESMIAEFIEGSDLGAEVHVDSEIEPNAVLVTVWDWTKQDETTEPIKTFMQENNILGSLVEFLILEGAEETVLGDANGDNELTVRDCAFIASALAKGFVGQLDSSADFNGDGNVNVRDAAAISRSLAGAK